MPDNPQAENRAKAEAILTKVTVELVDCETSDTARAQLVGAIQHDLAAAAHGDRVTEERFAKLEEQTQALEGQTHALSEAVIAITDTAAIAPAVQAVKDKM